MFTWLKTGLHFEKNPRNGYLFQQKWPLEMGMGFEAQVAHPTSKPSLYTSPNVCCSTCRYSVGGNFWLLNFFSSAVPTFVILFVFSFPSVCLHWLTCFPTLSWHTNLNALFSLKKSKLCVTFKRSVCQCLFIIFYQMHSDNNNNDTVRAVEMTLCKSNLQMFKKWNEKWWGNSFFN